MKTDVVLGWTATIVVSFIVSIVANLFTPTFKNWYASTSAARARRRLAELKTDLAFAEQAIKEPTTFVYFVIGRLARLIAMSACTQIMVMITLSTQLQRIIGGSTSTQTLIAERAAYIVSLLSILYLGYLMSSISRDCRKVWAFERYKDKTIETIRKLQQSLPPDLPQEKQ